MPIVVWLVDGAKSARSAGDLLPVRKCEVLDELFADVHAIEEELLEVEIALEESPLGAELDRLLNQQAALVEEKTLCHP